MDIQGVLDTDVLHFGLLVRAKEVKVAVYLPQAHIIIEATTQILGRGRLAGRVRQAGEHKTAEHLVANNAKTHTVEHTSHNQLGTVEQHVAHMRQHTLRLLDLGLTGFPLLVKEVEARLELSLLPVYPLSALCDEPIDLFRIRAYADRDQFLETAACLVYNHNAHAARVVPLLPDEHHKNR